MRDARHGLAGLSALGMPSSRASARTCALPAPASSSGWRTPCSAAARSPGRQSPRVVRVGARQQRGVAAPRARAPASVVVELGLAEVAAVRAVAAIALARQLVGRDRLVRDPDRRGDPPRARRARPSATDGETAVTASARRPERARGDRGHQRRVDAAGEGHDGAAERPRSGPRGREQCGSTRRRPRSRRGPPSGRRRCSRVRLVRGGERARPDRLDRRAGDPRPRARSRRARARG